MSDTATLTITRLDLAKKLLQDAELPEVAYANEAALLLLDLQAARALLDNDIATQILGPPPGHDPNAPKSWWQSLSGQERLAYADAFAKRRAQVDQLNLRK
jgi:hypothetical protein